MKKYIPKDKYHKYKTVHLTYYFKEYTIFATFYTTTYQFI